MTTKPSALRDRAATGPNVRERVAKPLPGTRCPRCHRNAGERFWGIPCALCSPYTAGEVLRRALRGELVISMEPVSGL